MNETPTKYPENAPGVFYVNSDCVDCDLCANFAPNNFRRKEPEGYYHVCKQPTTPEEESQCLEALEICPVQAIWNNGDGVERPESVQLQSRRELAREEREVDPADDEDRVDCPFCGKMHYPGSGTAEATEWCWEASSACEHLLFLAVDVSAFSGFEYRSRLFNEHLSLPNSNDAEILIPSEDDPECEEFLSISEIIQKISLPGLELRGYEDPGGIACGPVGGGDVTFGFVPQKAD
jgi:ferredoxin